MLTQIKTINKLRRIEQQYEKKIFSVIMEIPVEYFETTEHLHAVPDNSQYEWRKITAGMTWGAPWTNAWFRGAVEIPESLNDKDAYIQADTGAVEALFFVNGEACGIFTDNARHPLGGGSNGNHHTQLLKKRCAHGEKFHIHLECYAGHPVVGTQPVDNRENICRQASTYRKEFKSIRLVCRDEVVKDFVFDLKVLNQLIEILPNNSFRKGKIVRTLMEVYQIVPQLPDEVDRVEWLPALETARKLMKPLLDACNGSSAPIAGLTGHSHIDTAWLWTIEETIRKCARTFSSVISLMEQYPEFRFMQSSTIHLEMMQKYYPDLFAKIKQRIAEKRWEPNGGVFVETDGSMPSGESFIRQFIFGQKYTEKNFNYQADCFWLPDTFGYSAALPQIMRGCNIPYFLTTKLSWNESNKFPYDSFSWKGLDGSVVLVHFNHIHCSPDPRTLVECIEGKPLEDQNAVTNHICHTDVNDTRLVCYGFGDGGGGPMYEMLETARRVTDLEGCPRSKHVSVSDFMQILKSGSDKLPVYCGELYFEGARGSLTVMHMIKKLNRQLEISIRELDYLNARLVAVGQCLDANRIESLWKILLKNQFHDILSGTCIPEVHDQAVKEMSQALEDSHDLCREALEKRTSPGGSDSTVVSNSLSWTRRDMILFKDIPDEMVPYDKQAVCQHFTDISGEKLTVVLGLELPPFSETTLSWENRLISAKSPFKYENHQLITPFYRVCFNEHGSIESLFDLRNDRELRGAGHPLGTLLLGEDIPDQWDNWDIDRDQVAQMKVQKRVIGFEVTANGPLMFCLKLELMLGRHSKLYQHIIFYSDHPRIDFDTRVSWHETHQLLKAEFDLNILASHVKSEIQFGHIARANHYNTPYDMAKFEYVQHKWSDISETRYGVAILNEGKYGFSANGSCLKLSLLKSGGHPDPRGDEGEHRFRYALLPHVGGFSAETVIRPAYEFNVIPIAVNGRKAQESDAFMTISCSNVIAETLKRSETGNSVVIRLYEAEGTACRCQLRFANPPMQIEIANMLEEPEETLNISDNVINLNFRAFEIKTLILHYCVQQQNSSENYMEE